MFLPQWKMDGGNKRNLNCFYSIFANKRNSLCHFKYIKNHKIIPRNCCFGVITLCSPKNVLFISMILKLNCFYSIFAKKRNSHGHFKYIKNIKLYLGIVVSVLSLCVYPIFFIYFFLSMILNLNCFYSIFAKKCNSHGHFKYTQKNKIIPRNCCFSVITLCSPPKKLFLLNSNI